MYLTKCRHLGLSVTIWVLLIVGVIPISDEHPLKYNKISQTCIYIRNMVYKEYKYIIVTHYSILLIAMKIVHFGTREQ